MPEGVVGWTSDEMKQKAAKITANPASASTVSAPGPPDSLEVTTAAINQLMASSSRLDLTFAAADTEAGRMASALIAAADTFDKVVSTSKEEFDKQMHSDGARPSKRFETVVPSGVMDAAPATVDVPYPASAETGGFANWRESAKKIHSGDGTSGLKDFMDEWASCKSWLENTHVKDFEAPKGDGTAAEAYTNAMTRLREWWGAMIPECGRMVEQAQNFIDAHRDLVSEHPTMDDVATYEKMDPGGLVSIIVNLSPVANLGKGALNKYFQERSEAALKKYADRVAFKEIRPGMPPSIRGLPSTNPGGQPPGVNPPGGNPPGTSAPPGGTIPEMPEMPSVDMPSMSPASADPSAGQGSGGSPSGGGAPSGGAPSGGAPSGGMPSGGLPKGTQDMPEVPGLGEPSLKPASAGGGGGGMGGGGGGMPAGPLGPAVGADSVAASPAAARGGGAPAGAPGGAGAGGMGGGGMGGMGGGHGQGQGKEKRRNPNLTEDEDLYVEDRAYTEAVIGRRARKDAKDSK